MTNEEAKKMLEAKKECLRRETSGIDIDCNYRNCDECDLNYEQGNMGEQQEALDIAIKALESQPCEDCISREAVDELSKELVHTTRDKADFLCNFWERLQKLPSVTPHKRGKWLDKKTTIKGGHGLAYGRYGCSVCKKKQPSKTDFCPNCGADMRESGNKK